MYKELDFSNTNIDKTLPTISISEVLEMLVEPFDSDGVAQKTHDKYFDNPDSEYYQMSKEQILEAWSAKGAASTHYGKLLDDYIGFNLEDKDVNDIEIWKLDNNYEWDDRLHGLCDSFDKMYEQMTASGDVVFVDREKTVYYKIPDVDCYVKGRFDALFYNKRLNKWIIDDWKSSGNVDKTGNHWTKNLFGPMCKYPALNWYTYTLQTHFYKKAMIEMGYLPEGTRDEDVVTLVVQLPGRKLDNNQNYEIHKQAFQYDSNLLDKVFKFAYQKKQLLKNKK